MRYQLLRCADNAGQPGRDGHTELPATGPAAGEMAGATGLQWLWGMVEMRLEVEPDTAA